MCGMWIRSLLKVTTWRETTSGSGSPWALMEANGSMVFYFFLYVFF